MYWKMQCTLLYRGIRKCCLWKRKKDEVTVGKNEANNYFGVDVRKINSGTRHETKKNSQVTMGKLHLQNARIWKSWRGQGKVFSRWEDSKTTRYPYWWNYKIKSASFWKSYNSYKYAYGGMNMGWMTKMGQDRQPRNDGRKYREICAITLYLGRKSATIGYLNKCSVSLKHCSYIWELVVFRPNVLVTIIENGNGSGVSMDTRILSVLATIRSGAYSCIVAMGIIITVSQTKKYKFEFC